MQGCVRSACLYLCGKKGEGAAVSAGHSREEGANAKGKAAIKAQSAHPLPPISVGGV